MTDQPDHRDVPADTSVEAVNDALDWLADQAAERGQRGAYARTLLAHIDRLTVTR